MRLCFGPAKVSHDVDPKANAGCFIHSDPNRAARAWSNREQHLEPVAAAPGLVLPMGHAMDQHKRLVFAQRKARSSSAMEAAMQAPAVTESTSLSTEIGAKDLKEVGTGIATSMVAGNLQQKLPPLRRAQTADGLTQTVSILNKPYSSFTAFYEVGKVLGEGLEGVIRECYDRFTGEAFACKLIRKSQILDDDDIKDIRNQVKALELVGNHPAVCSLRETMEDNQNLYLIMELCKGGELFSQMKARKRFTERDAARICRMLASVIKCCNSQGLMHRDLKPENILLVSPEPHSPIRVIDFGQATFFTPGKVETAVCGSSYYIAPEVLRRSYGPEADMWSLGVICYILLCGVPPFYGKSHDEIFSKVLVGRYDLEKGLWKTISVDAKDFVAQLLNIDPSKRLKPAQVEDHPWICQNCSAAESAPRQTVLESSLVSPGVRLLAPAKPAVLPLSEAIKPASPTSPLCRPEQSPPAAQRHAKVLSWVQEHCSPNPPEKLNPSQREPPGAAPVLGNGSSGNQPHLQRPAVLTRRSSSSMVTFRYIEPWSPGKAGSPVLIGRGGSGVPSPVSRVHPMTSANQLRRSMSPSKAAVWRPQSSLPDLRRLQIGKQDGALTATEMLAAAAAKLKDNHLPADGLTIVAPLAVDSHGTSQTLLVCAYPNPGLVLLRVKTCTWCPPESGVLEIPSRAKRYIQLSTSYTRKVSKCLEPRRIKLSILGPRQPDTSTAAPMNTSKGVTLTLNHTASAARAETIREQSAPAKEDRLQ